MPFFLAMDLPIATEMMIQEEFAQESSDLIFLEDPSEETPPGESSDLLLLDDSLDEILLEESSFEPKPVVLEGPVENFDPVSRAKEIAKSMPRELCGVYRSFSEDSKDTDVKIVFSSIQPIGQIINLRGNMIFGSITTPLQGNLNAKSDQLDLIPLSDKVVAGIEPGGRFLGLQGPNLLGWEAASFIKPGGMLKLSRSCDDTSSKAPAIRAIW